MNDTKAGIKYPNQQSPDAGAEVRKPAVAKYWRKSVGSSEMLTGPYVCKPAAKKNALWQNGDLTTLCTYSLCLFVYSYALVVS